MQGQGQQGEASPEDSLARTQPRTRTFLLFCIHHENRPIQQAAPCPFHNRNQTETERLRIRTCESATRAANPSRAARGTAF